MAQLCAEDIRADVFTWYNLIGSAGLALGQAFSGFLIQFFTKRLGWGLMNSYRAIWVVYAILGIAKLAATLGLSQECEIPPKRATEVELENSVEAEGLLASDDEEDQNEDNSAAKGSSAKQTKRTSAKRSASSPTSPFATTKPTIASQIRSALPKISAESRSIVTKLCFLFAVDSFASGLVTMSWLSYFFSTKFGMAASALGTLFFTTSVVASASNLVSASLARRIGLIKTMVFTHFPSAFCLAMIPVPSNQGLAMMFLILRHSTSTMDRAPRQAFLAAAVLDHERTAVMGLVNVVKTLAQSAGPGVTGYLAGIGKFWIAIVTAGALKATYDLTLLKLFVSFKGRNAG